MSQIDFTEPSQEAIDLVLTQLRRYGCSCTDMSYLPRTTFERVCDYIQNNVSEFMGDRLYWGGVEITSYRQGLIYISSIDLKTAQDIALRYVTERDNQ